MIYNNNASFNLQFLSLIMLESIVFIIKTIHKKKIILIIIFYLFYLIRIVKITYQFLHYLR